MGTKKNQTVKSNGKTYQYYRITRTVGHEYKDGKKIPIKKQFTGTSKRNAEEKYELWKQNRNSNEENITLKTFGELLEFYSNNILKISSKYANGTKEVYLSAYKNHLKDKPITKNLIEKLKSTDIQMYYNDINITSGALSHLHKFLTGFFKWASANDYCKNIIANVEVPVKKIVIRSEEIIIWSDSEISMLTESDDYYLKPLIVFATYTGMRISELLGLKWSDIDENMIHVRRQYCRGEWKKPKTGKERSIPIHKKIKEIVESADKKYDLVFTTSIGTPLDYKNVVRSFERYCRRKGITYKKLHSFRATFCTNLCKNGVPIQVASKLMGHSNINVTAQYYTFIEENEMLEAVKRL